MTKLIALDLDGTLTQHKSRMETGCRDVLTALSKQCRMVMVCAGGCERVYRQMGGFPVDILGFYGMECSTVVDGDFQILEKVRMDVDRAAVSDKVEQLRNEWGFTNYYGDSVEFHASGMITFPLLGASAPLGRKLAFDPDRSKRRKLYRRVCEAFEEYNVFVGGSSSFDMVPKPFRKLYALEQYFIKHGMNKQETVYFGDDYGFGGNDSDIYQSGIPFIRIDDYRNFPQIAKEVLL